LEIKAVRKILTPTELASLLGLKPDTIWRRIHRAGMYKSAKFARARWAIPLDDPDVPEHVRQAWTEIQGKNAIQDSSGDVEILVKRVERNTAAVEKTNALMASLLKRLGVGG
jgi:hypothetical protein